MPHTLEGMIFRIRDDFGDLGAKGLRVSSMPWTTRQGNATSASICRRSGAAMIAKSWRLMPCDGSSPPVLR